MLFDWLKKNQTIAGLALSLVFLYFVLRHISWHGLALLATQVPISLLAWVIILSICARLFSTFRWWILLSEANKTSVLDAFHYINIGYYINSIFPARAGDFIKAVLLAKKNNQGKTSALASVTVERLFDMVGLGMVFIACIMILKLPDYLKLGGFAVLALALFILILLLSLADRGRRVYDFLFQFSNKKLFLWFIKRIELVLSYSNVLRDATILSGAAITTAIIWFLNVFTGFIIVEQISPGPYSWHVALLSLLIIGVSFVLPATPGNLGLYQFACVLAFSIADMPKEPALLYSLISQLPIFILNIVLGFYSMSHESIQRKSLQMDMSEESNI